MTWWLRLHESEVKGEPQTAASCPPQFERPESKKGGFGCDFSVYDAISRFPTWFVAHFLVEGTILAAHQNQVRRKLGMAKNSVGKGKAEDKIIVVCPNCGSKEFKFVYEMAAVNVYCKETEIQELRYMYSIVSISQNAYVDQVLICKSCCLELRFEAAQLFGVDSAHRQTGALCH
jgi:hypothetical protein